MGNSSRSRARVKFARLRRQKQAMAAATMTAAVSLVASSARGTVYDWTEINGGNWSVAASWNPSPPPAAGSTTADLTFYSDGTTRTSYTSTNNIGNPFTLHSLVFKNFSERDITVAGTALRFAGTTPFISLGWTGKNAVLAPIQLSVTTTYDDTFGGVMLLGGAISSTGGLTINTGVLHLTGANTYSGVTTVNNSGVLVAAAAGTLSANSAIVLNGFSTALKLKLDAPLTINSTTVPAGSFSQTIAGLSGNGSVELGQATLSLGGNNASTTFSGQINGTGSAALTKLGTGTLTLSNSLTIPQLNINAGRIRPGSDFALSSVLVNLGVANGLDFTGFTDVVIGGLSGSASLALGTTNLSVVAARPQTYSGILSGSGAFTKSGGDLLELSGTNTYTGGTTVDGGTLRITKDAALGAASAPLRFSSGGALQFGASFTLGATRPLTLIGQGAIDTGTFSTTISQSIGELGFASVLRKLGTGTLTLSNAGSTYTGGTFITAGTLVLTTTGAAGTGDITLDDDPVAVADTALLLNPNLSLARNIVVNPSAAAATSIGSTGTGSATFTGDITLNRNVSLRAPTVALNVNGGVSGTGGVTIDSGFRVNYPSGTKTYSGVTSIPSGTLTVSSATASPVNSVVALGATGRIEFTSVPSSTIGGLSGSAGGVLSTTAAGTSAVRIGNNNASTTYAGLIIGATSIEKIGAGTLVLAGANTYSGATTFTGGVLQAGASSNLGNSSATNSLVFGGGTLRSTGSFTTNRALTVNAGGGSIDATGQTLTLTGATTINGLLTIIGGTAAMGNADGTGSTKVNAGGLLIANRVRQAGLTVDGTVRTRAGGGNSSTTALTTLSISASGALDLNDNDLIVNNGNFAAIRNLVLQGFGASTGITTSTSNGSQILALFNNALIGAGDWNGVPIGPNAIVGKYTYFGDVNFDGQVTGDDYTIIDSNLNTTPPVGLEWLSGDANIDGIVTGDDYTTIDSNLGLGVGNPLSPSALEPGGIVLAPEPGAASLALVGVGTAVMSRRRRAQK